jgi:hypothetical protein
VSKSGDDGRDGIEIDIVEIPWRGGQITMNLHWDGYAKDHKSAGTKTTILALTDGFHDYGLLWTKAKCGAAMSARRSGQSACANTSLI